MVDPETFTTGLLRELHSSHEPRLVPFLNRNLSALQHSLISGELSIDGVRSPQSTVPRNCPLTKHKVNDCVFVRQFENGIIWPGRILKIEGGAGQAGYEVQMYGVYPYTRVTHDKQYVLHDCIFIFNQTHKKIFIGQKEKGSADALNEIELYPEVLNSTDEPKKKKRKIEWANHMKQNQAKILNDCKRKEMIIESMNKSLREKQEIIELKENEKQSLQESVTGLEQEKNVLLEFVTERDEKIQTLEADLETICVRNHLQIRNLDKSVTDLQQEKNNLLETVVEKDEKIQTLEADLERTIDQNHMQIQNLEESVSKNTDLEQILAEKDEKIKTLEEIVDKKDMQIQNLEESVTGLVERVGNLKDDLEKTTEQKNIKNKALIESDAKLKKFEDIMAAKDEKIQTLEANFEKMIDQNNMQVQNLEESVKDLEQEKTNLVGTVAENDEKIQTLKAELEKSIDQNQMQTQNLDKSVCKITDLEQEKHNLRKAVDEKDERIQNLKNDLEKTMNEMGQMKQIEDDLQEQVALFKKLKNLLAAKVLLFDPNSKNLETLQNLQIEELFEKFDKTYTSNNSSFKEKYEDIEEKYLNSKIKLRVQTEMNEILDKQMNEIMDTLNIPDKNRTFHDILPAIEKLKRSLSISQEQEETEHYTNAINSIANI